MLLEAREPIEVKGRYGVEPVDPIHRLLSPRNSQLILRMLEKKGNNKMIIIGLDSSSRSLETPIGSLVIGGAATGSTLHPVFYEVPCIDNPACKRDYRTPGFIAFLPNTTGETHEDLLGSNMPGEILVLSNPAGRIYDRDYSLEQALDEMRLTLENHMLEDLIWEYTVWLLDRGMQPIVLVDGPVYPLANALASPQGVPGYIVEAWRSLTRVRAEAVRRLEELGVPVVGVVKRLDRATIISRLTSSSLLWRCLPSGGLYGDGTALYRYLEECARWRRGSLYVSPRLRIVYQGLGDVNVREKIVEYVVIPPGAYQKGPAGARFYRLEYSPKTMKLLETLGIKGFHALAGDTIRRGSLEPVTIKTVDRRVKMATRSLRMLLASMIARMGLPVSYESAVEVGVSWRGRRRGVSAHGW